MRHEADCPRPVRNIPRGRRPSCEAGASGVRSRRRPPFRLRQPKHRRPRMVRADRDHRPQARRKCARAVGVGLPEHEVRTPQGPQGAANDRRRAEERDRQIRSYPPLEGGSSGGRAKPRLWRGRALLVGQQALLALLMVSGAERHTNHNRGNPQ